MRFATIVYLRNWVLTCTLALLTIPGFIDHDMFLFGIRLGRFQPFKFFFVFWLLLQTMCVFSQYQGQWFKWIKSLSKKPLCIGLVISIIALDFLLGLSLVVEGNPARGSSILIALILGELAALVTIMDKHFPARSVLLGFFIATCILFIFSIIEIFFPNSAFIINFLNIVRDAPNISFQLGSSLSVAALAEFIVRALPLVLLFSRRYWWCAITSFSLMIMGVMTLEKSAFLSIIAILLVVLFSNYGRRYWKHIILAITTAVVLTIGIIGYKPLMGRFFGTGSLAGNTVYSKMSDTAMKERLYVYKLAIQVIKAKPWLGIGLDGFSFRSQEKKFPLKNAYRPDGSHTHNLFLEMAVSGGIFALFAFVLIFGIFTKLCVSNNSIYWCSLLYLSGQFVSCMVDARICVSWLAITLFWFAGIARKLDEYEQQK
ncbi:MAG: O-antigen ligase family protein [Deltaproteobacteria bacterium]|nr:O-antigen ligase family protein [Deltaproteobacteria bacterium]